MAFSKRNIIDIQLVSKILDASYKLTCFPDCTSFFQDYFDLWTLLLKQILKHIPFQTFSDFQWFLAYKVPLELREIKNNLYFDLKMKFRLKLHQHYKQNI